MDGALCTQLSQLSPAASARVSRQREYWAAASSRAPFFRTRVGWPGGIVGSTRRRNGAIRGFRGAVQFDGAAGPKYLLTNEESLGTSDAMLGFLARSRMDRARRTCF